METALTALLRAICPRAYPDFAPPLTAPPFVTYQHIGGTPLRYIDTSATDLRNTLVQINVWSSTRAASLAMVRQIEEAICTSAAWSAEAATEPTGQFEDGVALYGCQQDFEIWADRN